jgi:hypothetical protein
MKSYKIECGGWGAIGLTSGYTYHVVEVDETTTGTRRTIIYRGEYDACEAEMHDLQRAVENR